MEAAKGEVRREHTVLGSERRRNATSGSRSASPSAKANGVSSGDPKSMQQARRPDGLPCWVVNAEREVLVQAVQAASCRHPTAQEDRSFAVSRPANGSRLSFTASSSLSAFDECPSGCEYD